MDTNTPTDRAASLDKLKEHIQKQLQLGLKPDEITGQLKVAGWDDATIKQAFAAAQAQVVPSPATVPATAAAMPGQQSSQNVPARGRIKTGWLLFKESWKILKNDETLLRYVTMSAVYTTVLAIIYILIIVLGRNIFISSKTTGDTTTYNLLPLGYVPTFIFYILAYFIVNLYAAGLAANVLDLFHGNKQPYSYYMKKARAHAGSLFTFSVIEATVGLILRIIFERSSLLGRIVTQILGAVWSTARLFVVPIIVSSDKGAVEAIKESTKLLVSTWGENLAGRAPLAGVLVLFYMLIMLPLTVLFIVGGIALGGLAGVIIACVLIILAFLAFGIVASAISSVLNTALFYYASTHQVPAVFDADLLNSAFRKRKSGLLGRNAV